MPTTLSLYTRPARYARKPLLVASLLLVLQPLLFSCSSIDELYTLSRCEFRVVDADRIFLAGVPLEGSMDITDLDFGQLMALLSAAQAGYLPLDLHVNVEIRNPNNDLAAMNKVEWILFLDDLEMTSGIYDDRVEIPPHNGTAIASIPVSVNLNELMEGEEGLALINLAMNLSGVGDEPSRITLRAKPYILVRNTLIAYPGFFDIRTEFTSGDAG